MLFLLILWDFWCSIQSAFAALSRLITSHYLVWLFYRSLSCLLDGLRPIWKADALFPIGQRSRSQGFIKIRFCAPISCTQSYRLESYCYWLHFFWLLGLPVWGFGLYCLLMLVLKWFLFQAKAQEVLYWKWPRLAGSGGLWKRPKADDSALLCSLYQCRHFKQGQARTIFDWWFDENLWASSIVRPSRISFAFLLAKWRFVCVNPKTTLSSSLALIFVSQAWIAAAFLRSCSITSCSSADGLVWSFWLSVLTQLFSDRKREKLKGARQIVTSIGSSVLLGEVLTALLFQDKIAVLAMLGATCPLLICSICRLSYGVGWTRGKISKMIKKLFTEGKHGLGW